MKIFIFCALWSSAFGLHLNKQSLYLTSEDSPGRSTRIRRDAQVFYDDKRMTSRPEISFVHIHSDIRYRYAKTVISSEIVNTMSNNQDQEVTFQAVLPETAFISKFFMEIDGIVYRAQVKPKEEAKHMYERAKDKGQTAGLVEINPRNANIFNLNINIKSGSVVFFNLWYEELLQRRLGFYQLQINLISDQLLRTKDFKIEVTILEPQDIKTLRVLKIQNEFEKEEIEENHDAIIDHHTNAMARVIWIKNDQLKKSVFGKSDIGKFTLQYDVKRESESGQILLLNGYFVHFFAPENIKPLRKHVVYVLDVSGSMSGRKIEQLRSAMIFVLDDLKPDDYFNIITFSSDVYVWRTPESHEDRSDPNTPIRVNERNLQMADKFIRGLQAGGGTDIYRSMDEALNLANKARRLLEAQHIESIIVFLTDGEPTVGVIDTQEITIHTRNRNLELTIPIYSLAFGTGADFNFLKKLSLQNYGFARKIYEGGDSDIQLKGFYAEISSPLLSGLRFKYTSGTGSDHDRRPSELTCDKFRNIFRGSEIIVAGRYPEKEGYTLNAEISSDGRDGRMLMRNPRTVRIVWDQWPYPWPRPWPPPRPWPIPRWTTTTTTERPTYLESQEDFFLERLWSYLTIRQLIDRDTSGVRENYEDYSGVMVQNPKERALQLAMKYEFVTPLTSLVIVKPDSPIEEIPFHPMEFGPRMSADSAPHGGKMMMAKRMRPAGPVGASNLMAIPEAASMKMSRPISVPMQRDESAEGEADDASDNSAQPFHPRYSTPHPSFDESKKRPVPPPIETDLDHKDSYSLRDIKWLKDKRTIWIDNLQYKVFNSNSTFGSSGDPPKEIAHDCTIKNNGRTGKCVHLKNCVIAEYVNDKEIYVKNYFCHISSGENYAGTCCDSRGLKYTHR